jgi:glycosyltransferase involved in cell wall biosynthesis
MGGDWEGSNLAVTGSRPAPTVSIGLPVYNGERYLAQAIESILGQTYTDFELIISDNASTDGTAEICAEAAARDRRIRYFRQERNLGAAPNHQFTFNQAVGEYFKWSAHDDILEPAWLERCVEVLDDYPDVQLAFPLSLVIDEAGVVLRKHTPYGGRLMSSRPSERFCDFVCRQNDCIAIFGLARRRELETTELITAREESDRHLLAELALRGRWYEIPEYLFKRRHHSEAYSHSVAQGHRMAWWDTGRADSITFPEWRSIGVYHRLINKTPLSTRERWACRRLVVRYLFGPRWYRQRWVKLIRDAARGGYRHAIRLTSSRG